MINLEEFTKIKAEVDYAIKEIFIFATNNEKEKNDYYLFLCNANYVDKYKDTQISPFVVDYKMDYKIDEHRLLFLKEYLTSNYSFSESKTTSDSKNSLTMELMIYTHIWESKSFLKLLMRLHSLCLGNEYDWDLKIPNSLQEDSKQKLIRCTIRDDFNRLKLKMSDVITNGYRSQFRNAFAHSDYSFGLKGDMIQLHNYKPNSYEVESISFDEWTKYFCYSFLLNYNLTELYYKARSEVNSEKEVFLKNKNGDKKKGIIIYDKIYDGFSGKIIEE